jgi:Methyltransferase FkbM domain
VPNVTVLPYAVTDHDGPACLSATGAWLAPPRPGDSPSFGDQHEGRIETRTVSLGGYCEQHGLHPEVVKIDVEGAEAKVVAGGSEVLRRARAIVLEVHETKLRELGVDPATFRQSVDGLGKQTTVLHQRPDVGVEILGLRKETS